MIYSEDINKVCGLCVFAKSDTETDGKELLCTLFNKNKEVTESCCKKFKYDIFKKTVHRKRRLKTDFSADDFKL